MPKIDENLVEELDDFLVKIPDDIDHETIILAIRGLKDDSRLYENLTQDLYE
jgi:hypothetical protein